MSSDFAIRVSNLSKSYQIYDKPQDRLKQSLWRGHKSFYREFWALKDVSFEVKEGETVGIIGPNGSGKSTLLQMICGTLTPTNGEVITNGRVAALLELGAGFNPEFTGRENVYINAAIMGLSKEETDDRFENIISFAEIGDFIDQPVKTFSSGMYVRLAFAIVVYLDADILIIDEALAVGDVYFTQKCMRFLRKFRESGTILFVSHDTAAVINLCHRAIWLKNGMVRFMGDTKSVCESYLSSFFSQSAELDTSPLETIPATLETTKKRPIKDQRLNFLNNSQYRNDIELFDFSPDQNSFCSGGAKITQVKLEDELKYPLAWVVGGEIVVLHLSADAFVEILMPILGFVIKDRLGQALFSDNTCLSHQNNPVIVSAGETIIAQFRFQMPLLPVGDYSIDAAIADGSQDKHVMQHYLNDALLFKSHSSSVCTGLIGIPMLDIKLEKTTAP